MRTTINLFSILIVSLSLMACGKKDGNANQSAEAVKYTCSMHPQIVEEKPGTCPICAMDLVPLKHNGNGSDIMLSDSQIKLAKCQAFLQQSEGA